MRNWIWGRVDYWANGGFDKDDDVAVLLCGLVPERDDGEPYFVPDAAEVKEMFGGFDHMIEAFFYCIMMGENPPPSVMAAMYDCWIKYLSHQGRMTLEEAFIEKPKPRVGNYASQFKMNSERREFFFEWMRTLRDCGGDRNKAAELMSARRGGKPDAASIIRMLGDKNFRFIGFD